VVQVLQKDIIITVKKTEEDWTEDKWFKTGDIGQMFPNFTFAIIDRKKSLIKPPHGEYISPERLESIYRNCSLVENIMVVVSSDHDELIAFVCPKRRALEDWASSQHIKGELSDICKNPKAEKLFLDELNKSWSSAKLKNIERISGVKLFPEEWSTDNGWLTAAMKIKRNEVQKDHAKEIEEIYERIQHK